MAEREEFDLQNMIDAGAWGPEPTENYLTRLNLLDNVVRECSQVSRHYAGIASPAGRHFYASVLFVALITRGVSLLNLAPHSPWAEKKIEHWDYASMTGIARTMIELRAVFHYLCIDPCSHDEWYCRWNILNLHDCDSRIRLFKSLGSNEQVAGFEVQAEELRERLRNNLFFQTLDHKRHKKLLHGQTAYLFPLEELAERAGMPVETFRWLHILFSTHVHGLPMSFYRIGEDNRGRGIPSSAEESYSALCLSLAASLLVKSRDELHILFEGLARDPAYVADNGAEKVSDESDGDDSIIAMGESMSVNVNSEIMMVRKRVSECDVILSYIYTLTGDVVFEGTISGREELQFSYIDPFFWEVILNGARTSRATIERMIEGEFLMRVDIKKRQILFKTRPETEG